MTPLTITPLPPEPDADWRDDASCAGTDPDAFFPEKGASNRAAKKICGGCAVAQCLAETLQYDTSHDIGVWAGMSAEERRLLRRTT